MYRRSFYRFGKRNWSYKGGKSYGPSRRGTIGRSIASAKGAKKATKIETATFATQGFFEANFGATVPPISNVTIFNPMCGGQDPTTGIANDNLPNHGGLLQDRGFRLKCASYDEFKIDSMKVTIFPRMNLALQTPPITVCTIWDRNANTAECGIQGATAVTGNPPTAQEIMANEGCIKTNLGLTTIKGTSRYLTANNMQEKSSYIDTHIIHNQIQGESPLRYMVIEDWRLNKQQFNPVLYLCATMAYAQPFGMGIVFGYKIEYNVTFRNPHSELTDFITLENPDYVNPDMRDPAQIAPEMQYIGRYLKAKEDAKQIAYKNTIPENLTNRTEKSTEENKEKTQEDTITETQPME